MDTITIIALLLMGICLSMWRSIVKLQGETADLRKSKDDLRESMNNSNYYLHQQLERVKGENEALRTQSHQLRMKQQKQDN